MWIKFPSSSRKHRVQNLEEDIKLVVMEKPGLEKRGDSKLEKNFLHFFDYHRTEGIVITTNTAQKRKPFDVDLDGRTRACSCCQGWLCLPSYMESNSGFWNFRTRKVLEKTLTWFVNPSAEISFIFGKHQNRRYQTSSFGEFRRSIPRWSIKKGVIWNLKKSLLQFKYQNQKYFHWECSTTKKHLKRTLKFLWRKEACSNGWQMRMSFKVEKN